VLTTKQAWAVTEAAYARGFDAPYRRPYQQLAMKQRDWLVLSITIFIIMAILFVKLET
jgi:energy-coupling factor transporter transmembrane protein EcfT